MVRKNSKRFEKAKFNGFIDKMKSSSRHRFNVSDGDQNEENINYGQHFHAAKGIFMEYLNDTTIHGLKYMGDQKRPVLERIVWVFALLGSILICVYLITNILDKRNNTPVIVHFEEELTAVWEIPFPSVTICPETKTHANIFNYTEMYWKLMWNNNSKISKEEKHYWEAISQTCLYKKLDYGKFLANVSHLISAIEQAAPGLRETLYSCTWRQARIICDKYYKTLTEEGLCFTFNGFNPKNIYRNEAYNFSSLIDSVILDYANNQTSEWELEKGYTLEAGENAFPARVLGSGNKESLFLWLTDKKVDDDLLCRGPVQGFKVILHTPGELPQVSKTFMKIPFDQAVSVSIKPKIVTISEGLRHYDPNRFDRIFSAKSLTNFFVFLRRKCYYQNERYLRYFKLYTQANCEHECLSNHTRAQCGCVKFSMPRNASEPVCGAKSMKCLQRVERGLLVTNFKQRSTVYEPETSKDCNCLPSCISIQYKAEMEHQTAFDYASVQRALGTDSVQTIDPGIRSARLTIYFKEAVFNALRRSELYSTTQFIANCGGLLGLFMGVSILSLVEFVYFFTIRLWVNLKMRKPKRKALKTLDE
ncbi:pickpocket protein 28-like [Episyrphus balteatus]|uniref:pickpocket protein 28-like n=1 Tax=Episyrphus balteatus TaxID=286459 RepID=UPI002486B0F8|nr:pickpocket protein 28-like [Episyrphus balteatus]